MLPSSPARTCPKMASGVRVERQRMAMEVVDSTPSTPPEATSPDPERLTNMSNELDERRQVINQLARHDEDGAGIERQEPNVPVGPPDEHESITPRQQERQEPHTLVGPPGRFDHGQDSMTPRQQRAVDVARQHMKIARTDVELHQAVHTLALALGATRVEEGTLKALHAVLFQMDHPMMSDKDAYTSKGASLSNFKKWRRAVLDAQLSREKETALTYEYTPARPRRVRKPSRQLSCQPSCQPSSQQLQTDARPTPGPAEPPPAGSVYNSTSVTQATVREWRDPHPHLQQYAPSRMNHSRTRHPHPYAPPEWRIRQEACPPPLSGRVKEPFRVAARASWEQHRAPGKMAAPPAQACLSAKAAMPPPPPRAPARLSPRTAKAEAERFVSQSLHTDTLENMTADEAIEMVMPLMQPQVQPASPCSTARARAETEGLTPVQTSKEGKGKSHYTDILQDELDRFAAAEELQPTTIEAAMPPPPPPTVALPAVCSATGALPIVLPIETPNVLPNAMPIVFPIDIKPMPWDLSPPPQLLPSPQTRLAPPGAPPPALAPATAEPLPATAAPFRASELLTRAAEFRTQASELLTRAAALRSLMEGNSALPEPN